MAARKRNYKFQKPHFAHAKAICRNPPIHTFTSERQNFTDPQQADTSAWYIFTKILGQAIVLWTQHFDRSCVCERNV
jgi:hypothetical protein